MRALLRGEHWIIQTFKFDRMSNNLIWLTVALVPLVVGVGWWLLHLHDEPRTSFILLRDPAFSGEVAEITYQDGTFVLHPRKEPILLNFTPITAPVNLQENMQLVLGHTIFQVRQLEGWTPHLKLIGYYVPDRDLHDGITVGRSIHPEELNRWRVNEIIVQDSSVEPVHFTIRPAENNTYQVKSIGQKGIYVPMPPPSEETTSATSKTSNDDTMHWGYLATEGVATLQAGHRIAAGNSVFELVALSNQTALALKIIQGVWPEYQLSREGRNIIGGLRLIPGKYIPDYLVDEEFIEYVRQTIEHGLFALDETGAALRVRGFDANGKLALEEFEILSSKEKFLLHKIFNFREQEGARLRWRRPFNRDSRDGYAFDPQNIENFIIDSKTLQIKNIYRYAAYLTNPHTIAEELATERGEIYDRDRFSHARLLAYANPNEPPLAELLLAPFSQSETMLTLNTKKSFDNIIYVAGGYQFSDKTIVRYEQNAFHKIVGANITPLQPGETFTDGQYTFRYVVPGNGLLAQNTKTGRYYPLGQKLVHLVGYSYARSQFKGNLEKVFDRVLLGVEKKQPWWSLERTTKRTPGNNLILTIDDDLQRVVFAELQKKLNDLNTRYKTHQFNGAAIVINAEGEILASASLPSYNPNDIHSILQSLKESSEDHWNSSYINRATQKAYPPGSTMKVIMSTIALDNKAQLLVDVGNGQYMIKNNGGYFACDGWLESFRGVSFGRYGVPDFDGASHGALTLDQALTKSCNNTFAFLALSAGHAMIQSYSERYGFNKQFDFLPYQMFKDDVQLASNIRRELRDPLVSLASRVPDPKDELKITQLARMGIGQWEILATPLQMATVAMTVGNLGLRPYPHLVKAIEDRAAGAQRVLPYPQQDDVFPAELMAQLFPMMQHVVQIGSAIRMTRSTIAYYALKDHVAGKTGTAEVEDRTGRKFNVVWFTCFAPVERPQMAIAVVIEKGPIISGEAVEVARGIWEKAVLLYPEIFLTTPPIEP